MKSNFRKTTMTILLTLCMAISMFAVNAFAEDTDSTSTNADSTSVNHTCEKEVREYTAKQAARYIAGDNTYPKLDGYLFAGWYNNDTCSKEDAIAGGTPSGEKAFALFVPEHVLSIQAQVSTNLINDDISDDDDAEGSLRIITSVDSLLYRQVGFEVYYTVDGVTRKATSASNKVYSKLYEMGSTNEVWEKTPSDVFCNVSKYFKICTLKNFPMETYMDTKFTVKPYWITMDGDKIYGVEATKSFEEGCLRDEVWVTDGGTDKPNYGGKDNPYGTLDYAITHVENGGTVRVKSALTVDAWGDGHGKSITITGNGENDDAATTDSLQLETITFTTKEVSIYDDVVFEKINITLSLTNDINAIFAEGNHLKIAESVNITSKGTNLQIFGGSKDGSVESTNLELYAGTYNVIYGGGYGDVSGNTKVTIGGTVNENANWEDHDDTTNIIYGGSHGAVVHGNTKVVVQSGAKANKIYGAGCTQNSNVYGDTNIVFEGQAYSIYGGSAAGTNADTHVTMNGGTVYQIFGGCESNSMTGDTDVKVLGGTVGRRIYGGCYNNYTTSGWGSTNAVTGYTSVTFGPDVDGKYATLKTDYTDDSSASDWLGMDDSTYYAVSRWKENYSSENGSETGVFIVNDYNVDGNPNKNMAGETDFMDESIILLGDVSTAIPYHYSVNATSGGEVYSAGDCIYIKPDNADTAATVTIGGKEQHYTEKASYYPLPAEHDASDPIIVEFGAKKTASSDYKAQINSVSYYLTLEEAIAAAEKMENATIENLDSTKQLASIVIKNSENGTVVTDKKNCLAGETVTLSGVGNEGYYCVGIKVNGEEVAINTDGTYSFETEEKTYTVEGIFAEKVFKDNANWNLFTQNKGIVSLPSGGNGGLLEFAKQYTDMDLTITARNYVKDEVVDDVTKEERTDVLFLFENGRSISFGITTNASGTLVQTLNYTNDGYQTIYGNWAEWGTPFDTQELEDYADVEKGVKLRLIRVGTEIYIYLGDRYLATADLTNSNSGVTADTKATVYLRHYDDSGVQVDIPFEVTTDLNMVPVNVADGIENGQINCRNYYLEGETVTLQVAGAENYFHDSLKVNGKEVVTDYKDGTYTFQATEASYAVDASFKYKTFDNNANVYLINQNAGMVVKKSDTTDNGSLYFSKKYTDFDITMMVKDYDLDDDADGDGNKINRTNIRMYFDADQVNLGIARNTEGSGSKYTVQSMGGDTILPANTDLYKLTDEEIAKYKSDEGVEFRVIRAGTAIYFYVEGNWVYTADLTKKNTGEASTLTAESEATLRLLRYDDAKHEVQIPITVSDKAPSVDIKTSTDGNGTIVLDKESYALGEKVTFQVVGNENYFYNSLKVNDKEVIADYKDGSYSFTAKEPVYDIKASFAYKTFDNDADCYLTNQNVGMVVQKAEATENAALYFTKKYTNFDITMMVKDYDLDDDADGDGNYINRTNIRMFISDYVVNMGIARNPEGDGSRYTVQTMGNDSILPSNRDLYRLSDEEVAKYKSDEGVEFRVIRTGTIINFYVEGNLVCQADLTKTNAGADTGITATTNATLRLNRYDDLGNEVEIPITVSEEMPTIEISTVTDGNGTITFDKDSYVVGEEVTFTVVGNSNYFYNSLKVNGEEVIANYKDGSYTFTATELSNVIEASFAYKTFNNDANSYLINQNVGTVVQKAEATANAAIYFSKKYTNFDITMMVKDYDLDDDADGDGNKINRTNIRMFIDDDQVNMGIARNSIDGGGSKYTVQTMSGDTILPANTDLYTLTEDEIAKYKSDEGVAFRMVRSGTILNFYVDGHWVYQADLAKTNAGADSGITATTETTNLRLNRYDDLGTEVEIPITVSETVPELVEVAATTDEYGAINFDRNYYFLGDQVNFTVAGNDGYFYNSLKVNNENVIADYKDGSYSFTATETSNTVEASFAPAIFSNDANCYLINQNVGMVVQKKEATANAWVSFAKAYTNFDITMKIKEYDLDGDADGDGNNINRTIIRMYIGSYKVNMGIARNSTDDGYKYTVQTMGNDGILPANTDLYTLTAEELAKYKGDEGVGFRAIRNGTTINFYVDGHWVYTVDLTKTNTGADTGFTATKTATMVLARYDDIGNEVMIPITVSETVPEEVNVTTSTDGNGTITFDRDSYVVGEKITFTVVGNDGYFYNSLKVNGEEVIADYKDGSYTFTATETSYTIEASFAPAIFSDDANCYLINQNVGMVVQKKEAAANAWVSFAKAYTNFDITMKIKDYDLEGNADGDTNNINRTIIRMYIGSYKVNMGIARNSTDNGYKYTVQSMGNDGILPADTDLYTLTTEEIAKYKGDEGVAFRAIRNGTTINFYVDGHWVYTVDLTKTNTGADTGFTATKTATMVLARYDDIGNEVVIPITVSETVPGIELTSSTDGNGELTFDKEAYLVGEEVTLTVTPNTDYYCNSVEINGEEVEVNEDGTYTFIAKEMSYTINATFTNTPFVSSNQAWDLSRQLAGVVSLPATHSGSSGFLYFSDKYKDVNLALNVKDYIGDSTNSTLRQLVWFAFNNGTTASFSVTYTGPADNPDEWAYKIQSMNDTTFG